MEKGSERRGGIFADTSGPVETQDWTSEQKTIFLETAIKNGNPLKDLKIKDLNSKILEKTAELREKGLLEAGDKEVK